MKASKSIIPNREIDVRPLNQRESKTNIRKGITRQTEVININWAEKQLKLKLKAV